MDQKTLVIIASVILMIPFGIWFIRNWMRIVMKKQYHWFNIFVWVSFLVALVIFVILIAVALTVYK